LWGNGADEAREPIELPRERRRGGEMSITYIYGAMDPEMQEILRVLGAQDAHVVQATCAGVPVHPGNMYRADGWVSSAAQPLDKHVVLIECGMIPGFDWGGRSTSIIDHHREGDRGYGRPPAEYLEASSLGQVLKLLGFGATPQQRLIAAADHCLGAAYQGECPGVPPWTLRTWRVKARAAFQARTPESVMADISRAMDAIEGVLYSSRCGYRWKNLRAQELPELPEASAILGVPIMARPKPGPDGRQKVVVQQWSDDALTWWRDEGAVLLGYIEPYALLGRGIGGAYLP